MHSKEAMTMTAIAQPGNFFWLSLLFSGVIVGESAVGGVEIDVLRAVSIHTCR